MIPISSSRPIKARRRFSDIANGISQEYKFWLDDAFASGGSAGYDHKEMAHHRARRVGSDQAPFPRDGQRYPDDGFHLHRRRRYVGRRVRQRHAAVEAYRACWAPSTIAIFSAIPIPTRRQVSPNASVCSNCRAAAGRITTRRKSPRAAACFARNEKTIKPDAGDEKGLWRYSRQLGPAELDSGDAESRCRTAIFRRHRHLYQGQPRNA